MLLGVTVGKIQEKYVVKLRNNDFYNIIRENCAITQRIAVIPYRRFGIPCGPIFKIPRFLVP